MKSQLPFKKSASRLCDCEALSACGQLEAKYSRAASTWNGFTVERYFRRAAVFAANSFIFDFNRHRLGALQSPVAEAQSTFAFHNRETNGAAVWRRADAISPFILRSPIFTSIALPCESKIQSLP